MNSARFNGSRRGFLRSLTAGSALAPGLIRQLAAAETGAAADPLAPHAPQFEAKAKHVIFLYLSGGVSHVDTWDPKPKLFADHGKAISVDNPEGKAINAYTQGFVKRPNWIAGGRRRETRHRAWRNRRIWLARHKRSGACP